MNKPATINHSVRGGGLASRTLAFAVFLGLAVTTSHAASITWGAATGITGDSDVSTVGTLVGAADLDSVPGPDIVVNGVAFTHWNAESTTASGVFSLSALGQIYNVSVAAAPFDGLSANYQDLLTDSSSFGGKTLTISGLTVAENYLFQYWANTSGSRFNGTFTTTATAGNTSTLLVNPTGLVGGIGQYAIGTFTADGPTQDIVFGGPIGAFGLQGLVAGFQLRQTAVPESGTALAGLLALGGCLSELGRRHCRQSAKA